MNYLYSIVDKVFYILLLLALGILVRRLRMLSDQGEKEISNLMMDLFWPALIFHSIVATLNVNDILDNIWLPLGSIFIHLAGYAVGLAFCRLSGYQADRRKVFLFHASLNNFFLMALPMVQLFFPQKGIALLAVANLGSILVLWTLGTYTIVGNIGVRKTLKNVCSPGLIATVGGILFVATGLNRYIPALVLDFLAVTGQPTMIIGMMVAGGKICQLGVQALRFDAWNLQVGLIRNILSPAIMLGAALLLRGVISHEILVMLMLVAVTPSSVNSVTMAIKYNSSPRLAAEGVIFTHLLAIITMPAFIALTDWAIKM